MNIEVSPSSFLATGTAEEISDLLFGPRQHDEHCRGWRWHLYIADNAKREASMRDELRKMIAQHREREDALSLWADA